MLQELYLNPEVREGLVGPAPSPASHQHFRARKASEAPSARGPGGAAAAGGQQRGAATGAAAQMAGGSGHWGPTRPARAHSAAPQADLFLPSKPQRLGSGLHAAGSVGGLLARQRLVAVFADVG